jgi:hypothetical protein
MKKLFIILSFFILTITLSAQEQVLFVPPGPVGTLNDVIRRDTLPNGSRVAGRVYELQRGAPYLINAAITNNGFPLHIRARAGTGERPLIMYSVPTGGTSLEDLFLARGELRLEGLNLQGRDNLAGFIRTAIRMDANKLRATINDCLIQEFSQTAIRGNADSLRLYMTNTVVNRIGKPDDPDNGRVYDDRNSTDTLVMENNAFYNITSRIIRDGNTSKIIIHARINQNTIYNILQRGFEIGKIKDFVFTNNLVVNTYAYGRTLGGSPAYHLNVDTTFAGNNWNIRNNNFFLTPEVRTFITNLKRLNGDTLNPLPYDQFTITPVGVANLANNINEVLDFRNEPPAPLNIINANAQDTVSGSTVPGAPAWDHAGIPKDANYSLLGMPQIDRFSAYHDFSYPAGTQSATGGTMGQRLGSFLFSTTTSTRNLILDDQVLLYPNPTRGTLFVQTTDNASFQNVQVFDIQGRLLQNLNNLNDANLELNLHHLPTGMYVVKAQKDNGKISVSKVQKQ